MGALCWQVVVAGLPFVFAGLAPNVAHFEHRWLPVNRWHWLAFPILVMLMLSAYALHEWLMSFREDWSLVLVSRQLLRDMSPIAVVGLAAVAILFAPTAEEIFWRAFLLSQLGKLTQWPIAVTIQSLLFSLAHLPNLSLAHLSNRWSILVACFFYGMILGVWWFRFRSLLPLVVAHIILNSFVFGPYLMSQYRESADSYPKCREIDRLTGQSAETAVPALIGFMTDRSDVVSSHAVEVLGRSFRSEAELYLAQSLRDSDDHTVEKALFAVEHLRYSSLAPLVRRVAWSSNDINIQMSAVITLRWIGDLEGVRDIAQDHLEERVRRVARDMLERLGKNR